MNKLIQVFWLPKFDNKKKSWSLLALLLIILLYLLLPPPKVISLPDATVSDEPGDTIQIQGVSAYFTNMTQEQVIDYYGREFSHSSWLGIAMPTLVFSRPVQEAHQFINDQLITTYLFEFIHPFRESVYVNGWVEGKLPPVYRRWINHSINPKGIHFDSKVTVRRVDSSLLARVLVMVASLYGILMLVRITKIVFSNKI
ncbi:hypothetical protein HY388_02090 [Candidatus Daviesbacteria bacterium]|nr:hypothetical protein [Candidatus Daviesbacteria bacterium]